MFIIFGVIAKNELGHWHHLSTVDLVIFISSFLPGMYSWVKCRPETGATVISEMMVNSIPVHPAFAPWT